MTDWPTHLGNPKEAIKEAESEAIKFAALSDDVLVGLVGIVSSNIVREAAVAEMQRRLKNSIRDFNATSTRQAKHMIRLTWVITVLTAVVGIMAVNELLLTAPAPCPVSGQAPSNARPARCCRRCSGAEIMGLAAIAQEGQCCLTNQTFKPKSPRGTGFNSTP